MKKSLALLLLSLLLVCHVKAFNTNMGEVGNLVCFVRFADEDPEVFEKNISVYETLFNSDANDANSVYRYFYQASYGQLSWRSTFFPEPSDGKIVSYCAHYERDYYRTYEESLRPTGYQTSAEGESRMLALVREIAAYLSNNLPDAEVIDKNDDGMVYNLCIVFSGQSELTSKRGVLWPQRKDLALPDESAIYVKGKKLVGYLQVFDEANGYENYESITLNTGVLCHEMSHSLGTYDLYHASGELNPVGVWDLMSDNQKAAQNMTAYTKWRYCKWLDEIPEISESGTYSLNPIGGDTQENIAYKIKPLGSDEYFMVEYRKQEGFDANLPGAGLLVYRINPAYMGGNVNYNGTTRLDEQYIFRPGGTTSADGDLSRATFSEESGRTVFGDDASQKPFYSNGQEAPFAITNVSACGSTISFNLQLLSNHISVSQSNLSINGTANSSASLSLSTDEAWEISGLPDWLVANQLAGEKGTTELVFTAKSDNNEPQSRKVEILISCGGEELAVTVVQASNVVTAPSALKGTLQDDGVHLSWAAATAGKPILADDFENTANPNEWEVTTSGDRGWRWEKGQTDKGYYRPYEGNYAATVYYAWEDIHQDENFTSKTFANGKTLTFYSRTPAAGATPMNPQYYNVEVSSDNGKNWTPIFNACTNQTKEQSGKYVKVTLDLTDYQSAEMKIRFHCYDTDNMGLSYYWQVDNLEILGAQSAYAVTGYNVYRNGKLIASTQALEYLDNNPEDGDNIYSVTAIGNFGESSPSDSETIKATSTVISLPVFDSNGQIKAVYDTSGRKLNDTTQMKQGNVYILQTDTGRYFKVVAK